MESIEGAKTRLFAEYCETNKDRVFTGFQSARHLHFMAGFDAAISYMLSLPLANRLTSDEKKQIETIYFRKVYSAEDVRQNFTEKCLIEALFGIGIFAEKGGDNENIK